MGVNGFIEDHKAAFAKHGVKNVWIAYDRDDAGDAAAEKLKVELAAMGIGSHRVLFPKGMDANEYGLRVQPPSQSFAVLLNGAEWWQQPEAAKSATWIGNGCAKRSRWAIKPWGKDRVSQYPRV